MSGKIVGGLIVLLTAIFGLGLWYAQTRAYYTPVQAQTDVVMTTYAGVEEPLPVDRFEGIDAETSPLRYRACFDVPYSLAMLTETFQPYTDPTPLTAPGWFGCFDAERIGGALESGVALAFLGTENIVYGFDRVVAVDDTGRGYAWHQINACGAAAFEGERLPTGCPPPPAD